MHGATGGVTADLVGDIECQSCEERNMTQVLYRMSSAHPCASAHRNIIWTYCVLLLLRSSQCSLCSVGERLSS